MREQALLTQLTIAVEPDCAVHADIHRAEIRTAPSWHCWRICVKVTLLDTYTTKNLETPTDAAGQSCEDIWFWPR